MQLRPLPLARASVRSSEPRCGHLHIPALKRPTVRLLTRSQHPAASDQQHQTLVVSPGQQEARHAAQFLLPISESWELEIDEVLAKYSNMDERLDAMERQLLEMTRELRTGSASLTGGVTTITQGGKGGLPSTSGMSSPIGYTGASTRSASSEQNGTTSQLATDRRAAQPPAQHGIHLTGSTSRSSTNSAGLMPPDGPKSKQQIMDVGRAAAQEARAAQEAEEQEEEQEAGRGSPLQQALGAAKQAFVDGIYTPITSANHKDKPSHAAEKAQQHAAEEAEAQADSARKHIVEEVEKDAVARIREREHELDEAEDVAAARARLLQRAARVASHQVADRARSRKVDKKQKANKEEGFTRQERAKLVSRESLYGFNKLQSAITELANSGYIESVKQLRETLLIQEWDMTNRHLAKRKGVAMFERYVAERDLVHEIGGYTVISALYEDPDALADLLPNDRMRMLARAMMEECLNERRMQLYMTCNDTAKEMATLTSSGVGSRMLSPIKQGLMGAAIRGLTLFKGFFIPWARFIPFLR